MKGVEELALRKQIAKEVTEEMTKLKKCPNEIILINYIILQKEIDYFDCHLEDCRKLASYNCSFQRRLKI